jgi:hypothetical protein
LQGGGACRAATCFSNPANIAFDQRQPTGEAQRHLRSQSIRNPVSDWNDVYVPYCSGDVHIGDKQNVSVDGVLGRQQFRGRANPRRFEALGADVCDRGPGAFNRHQRGWLRGLMNGSCAVGLRTKPVTMVDDSGGDAQSVRASCMTDLHIRYWGVDKTLFDFWVASVRASLIVPQPMRRMQPRPRTICAVACSSPRATRLSAHSTVSVSTTAPTTASAH